MSFRKISADVARRLVGEMYDPPTGTHQGQYQMVRLDQIEVDESYQRPLDLAQVRAIAGSLDWRVFGTPPLSERENGRLVALDAQHRIAAASAAGQGARKVKCEVFSGLTRQAEARIYWGYQMNRRQPGARDRLRAQKVMRDPGTVKMLAVLAEHGLHFSTSPIPGAVRAITAVEWAASNKNLDRVLGILQRYPASPGQFDGLIIRALSRFLAAYPGVDDESLWKRLSKNSAEWLVRSIRDHRRMGMGDSTAWFVQEYNRGARGKKRI